MTLHEIMTETHKYVCELLNVDYDMSMSKNQERELVEARQTTMATIRNVFGKSYSLVKIGAFFNKDHATVIHAQVTIRDLIDTDNRLKNVYYDVCQYINKLRYRPKTANQLKYFNHFEGFTCDVTSV